MRTIALLLLTACTTTTSSETDARCPTTNAPTYASFGRQFFASYCDGCHARSALDRYGAPRDITFDSEAEIVHHAHAIDAEAAAGPGGRNTDMPDLDGPVLSAPTIAEREELGRFLACELAR